MCKGTSSVQELGKNSKTGNALSDAPPSAYFVLNTYLDPDEIIILFLGAVAMWYFYQDAF